MGDLLIGFLGVLVREYLGDWKGLFVGNDVGASVGVSVGVSVGDKVVGGFVGETSMFPSQIDGCSAFVNSQASI